MTWKPLLATAVVSAGLAMGSTYWYWNQRVTLMERQLVQVTSHLNEWSWQWQAFQQRLPGEPASLKEVNAVKEELTTTLTASVQIINEQQDDLRQQLEQNSQTTVKYVNELNGTLKTFVTESLHQNTERQTQLATQIENTHQAIEKLLGVIKQKDEMNAGLIPAGTIMAYAGPLTTAIHQQLYRAGWLVCDGSEFPISQYSALYEAIKNIYGGQPPETFKLPDFRGVFLRGLDLNKQLDPQRVLGGYQTDTNKKHTHDAKILKPDGTHEHQGTTDKTGLHRHRLEAEGYWFTSKQRNERAAITNTVDDNQEYWTTTEGIHQHQVEIPTSGPHTHTITVAASGEEETRPKNYPVIYIIKF